MTTSPNALPRVKFRAAIFTTLLLILVGCSPAHYGVFISILTEDITLEIRQLTGNKKFEGPEKYKLEAGKKKRAACSIAEVTALDSSGRKLFQQVLPGFRPLWEKYQNKGDREIHYLVTRDGVYPIPVEWRETWKQHKKEIIADFDLKAARQKLIKDGMLKE